MTITRAGPVLLLWPWPGTGPGRPQLSVRAGPKAECGTLGPGLGHSYQCERVSRARSGPGPVVVAGFLQNATISYRL